MARSIRQSTDRVASNADQASLAHVASLADFWRALEQSPHAFDLFFALRVFEAKTPELPRLGRANHTYQEPLRVGQTPALLFAPSTISSASAPDGQRAAGTLKQFAFGLFGPNGPMPSHLSELAYERSVNAKDHTLVAFADLFHHRAALLFYRAWANAQSTNSLDKRGDDKYSSYVGSLIGYGFATIKSRDHVNGHSLRFVSGHFARQARNSEGIESALAIALGAKVAVLPWGFGWLRLPPSEQTALGKTNARLGKETVVGQSVPDRQHRFRLRIGPLTLAQYRELLPKGKHFRLVIDWVRNYVGYEYEWEMQLVLQRAEVPMTQLGATAQLGWTSWSRNGAATQDASEYVVMPEAVIRGPGRIAN